MEDITNTLRENAEKTLNDRQKRAQQYSFLNEALFKIKNPEYTSPYENIGQNTTRLFNRQEIQDIYDTLSPMYKSLADYGNPNDEQKKEMAAVKLATVFGTDYETAKKLTPLYYPMYAERDFTEKNYGTRVWNAIESSFYNDMIGYNSTIATLFDSKTAKKRADDYYEKMMKVRNWQDFGKVGNFIIDNMQGIYSMGKMALVTALTSGLGTALGASTTAIGITGGAINTIDSGVTQMGSNVYMMSKMTDDNGNPLFNFDNINSTEKVLFSLGAGLMGAIETLEFETFNKVLPKSIRNSFATAKATKLMNESFLKTISLNGVKTTALGFAKNVGKNILGEGTEEILQQFVGNVFETLEADIQNTRGASFGEEYSLENHLTEGVWDSFWGGLKGSVLASLLSVGTGTFLNNRAIKQAQRTLNQYQTKTDTSTTIFSDYVRNANDYNFSQEEIKQRAEEIKRGRVTPIRTYKAENFGLYSDSDGALTLKAIEMINPNLNIAEVEIANKVLHDISTEEKRGRFAKQFNGGVYAEDKNSFYFDSREDLENAKQEIAKINGVKLENDIVKVETTNGEQTFNLKTIEEIEKTRAEEREQFRKEIEEKEINPLIRHFMIFTDEESAKVNEFIKNNNIAKGEKEAEALNSFLGQIFNIVKKGKDQNVDSFLSSINIITEENENLKASIDIATEPSVSGYRQATIHLTKKSTFDSITHELNHYLQNNADIEDLRGFEEAYNIDLSNRNVWNEQISKELREKRKIKNKNYTYAELFANDATKYYTQGIAENEEMTTFFSKMKKALKGLVDFARAKFLNKKTIEAFDKLFNNSEEQIQIENVNKTNGDGIIIYYETKEEIDKTGSKSNNKKEKKDGQQEYQPTDDFRRIQEESRRLLNKFETTERTYKELDEGLRRRYSGYIQDQLQPTKCGYTYGNEFNLTNKHNITFTLCSEVNSQLFHDAFETIKPYLIQNELVDLHDNYKNSKCFLSRDGLQGFAIEDNGNLVSVFNADITKRGYLDAIKDFIKEQGATHLDCYGYLAEKYSKYFGFKTASLMDYNLDYDHHNIAKNYNMPQVAFMVNTEEEVETKYFNKDQYDEAQAWQLHYVNKDSKIIYYETEENSNNFIHTKEDVEEIKNKDWLLPPREEIKEVDEEIAYIYNTIDYWKGNGLDLVERAKEIKEDYELAQESETDINGILTEEDLEEINKIKESNEADTLKEIQVDEQLRYVFKEKIKELLNGELPNDYDNVVNYAWKLADVKTEREANTEFIYKYATDYDGLLSLIKILNKANTRFENGALIQDYNNYKGVADDILQLRRNSPKAKLREALTTIQNDPSSYRIAFEDATDILKGISAIEQREYNRSINSELLEYLGKKEEDNTLNEEEIEEKTTENLTNIRNLANLKSVKKENREALKRSEERLRGLQKDYAKVNKRDKKTIEKLQKQIEEEKTNEEKIKQKIAKYLTNKKVIEEIGKSKKLSKFNDKSHSIKGASSFYWVRLKFVDEVGSKEYNTDLNNLERINKILGTDVSLEKPNDLLNFLLRLNGLEDKEQLETLEDYKNLNSLLKDLRKVSRLQLKEDEDTRRAVIFETRKQAYNEAYGENGREKKGEDFTMSFGDEDSIRKLNERINSIENIEEREDFKAKVHKWWDRLFLAVAHPIQIARFIDNSSSEGTWQTLIENLKRSETALESSKIERYRNIRKEIKDLMGFDAKYLLHNKGKIDPYLAQTTNEEGEQYRVRLNTGEIRNLTRNEALMIYGYAIQNKGMSCLTSTIGNNFTRESVEYLVNELISDKDKKLVDILSEDLSSKDLDIARVYARQNNKIYNTIENYFPLYASQGSFQSTGVDDTGIGLRTTLYNNSNYVNKSFTKERTGKVYALKLDLWNNYIRGVDSQERYIYQSDWVRDAQNWISPRGMGNFLSREKGKLWTTTIKDFINDIAEPKRKVNELNGFMSKMFSNMMVANLMFNTVSAIKQVGAWFAVFTDPDFSFTSFCKAMADLTFRHKQTVDNILQANPSIDLQKGNDLEIFDESFNKNKVNRGVDTFKEWGLKMADFMDLQGRYVVWQSAYQSYIDKHGILDSNGNVDSVKMREAIRKADRIIEETQNSVKRSQLSTVQVKKGLLSSDKLAYTNSDFQYLNKLFDTYLLAKEKDINGVMGHIGLMLFNGAFMTLLSGVLLKPTNGDKEKEKEKAKEVSQKLAEDIIGGVLPFSVDLGALLGKKKYFSNSSVFSFVDIPSRFKKVIEDCREQEDTKIILTDLMKALGELGKPGIAAPKVMIDRLAKGITDEDSTTIDKTVFNVLMNLLLGTGFYNNMKGR